MSKVKDKEYLALTAMLRAREAKMPDRDRMERMLSAASFADAAKMLTDCGYEDMSEMSASEIDAALNARKAKIYEEIGKMSPEKELLEIFRLKYDYHNAKVIVKASGLGIGGDHLLQEMGRVKTETLSNAYLEDRYVDVPDLMAKAVKEAQVTLAKTGNSQAAEFILDRAYHEELTRIAGQQGSAYLSGYVKILIDSANLGAAVRTVRMKKGIDFLMTALFTGGTVSPKMMAEAALNGDGLAVLFNSTPLAEAALLGVEAMKGGSMTKFELACDNGVTAYLAKAKLISFGSEVVIDYLAKVEREITAIRMILTGRLAGIKPEVIRERLRDIHA